MIIFLE